MVLPCAAKEWRAGFPNQKDSVVLPKLRLPLFRIFRYRRVPILEIEVTPHHLTKHNEI